MFLNVSMETKGIAFLRFKKKCFIVCTESPHLNADVIGYDGKFIYEIEVKRSFSDFKADFKKISKHENMISDKGLANYFTFLVAPEIKDKCLAYLESLPEYNKYGLMIPSDNFQFVEVVRPARRIHNRSPHQTRVNNILKRMSSELANVRLSMDILNNNLRTLINKVDEYTSSTEEVESTVE